MKQIIEALSDKIKEEWAVAAWFIFGLTVVLSFGITLCGIIILELIK